MNAIYARAVRQVSSASVEKCQVQFAWTRSSFRLGWRYVTVFSYAFASEILHVAKGCCREALESYYDGVGDTGCECTEHVMMDMWRQLTF